MKDSEHPFFRPLWRRVSIVAGCCIWAAIEFVAGSPWWGAIAVGCALYGYWQLFHSYRPQGGERPTGQTGPEE
jgi:hypothetical protein